ncbi:hypothetical protein DPMN_064081 [Dreissena polymorpha]|uniref:Uncharacterized protein n=1 Tax=Dreissena polymorpha TaxID=45954 RepID=A0A9D4CCJ9_DREPO|nr:hypothetical protein DPMN_064081 [Dreissena polymorpha]
MTKLDPSKAIICEVDGEIESSPAQVTQKNEMVKPANTGEKEKEIQGRPTQENPETEINTEPMMEIGYTDGRDGGNESANVGLSDKRKATYVTQTRDESVLRAFKLLKVPEVIRKKPSTMRKQLPVPNGKVIVRKRGPQVIKRKRRQKEERRRC